MTVAVDATAPNPSTILFRRPALMWWPIAFTPEPRLPPGLSREQLQDAGIPLERAGFGRSADVSGLAITILESQR
ncbi:hypothetical protein ASD04_12945 [Devosia sp. Root436]|uniref:hypothetical protein n=1 Tax=Devosia sp. Root436 TaxID=1736537 RepID=UPI0006F3BEDA|nr:hypothetical protein [Devosia sp. Root436]KQX35682.1 hypothetical protein ASD04_12945 [Devosia sp. Root436]